MIIILWQRIIYPCGKFIQPEAFHCRPGETHPLLSHD